VYLWQIRAQFWNKVRNNSAKSRFSQCLAWTRVCVFATLFEWVCVCCRSSFATQRHRLEFELPLFFLLAFCPCFLLLHFVFVSCSFFGRICVCEKQPKIASNNNNNALSLKEGESLWRESGKRESRLKNETAECILLMILIKSEILKARLQCLQIFK